MSIPIASGLGRLRSTALRLVMSRQRWAVIDQVIISLANFVSMVFLARGLSLEGFGWFSVAHMTLLLSNSFQNNLVSLPHNVLGATRHGEDYIRYTTSTALSQVLLGTAEAGLVIVAWLVSIHYGWDMAPLVLALAPLIFFWQLNEFARRALYTEQRVLDAVVNDLLSNGTRVGMIGVMWWGGSLSPLLALNVLTITSAFGVILGWWQLRDSMSFQLNFSAFRENWNFGKWLVSSDIVGNWLSSKLFIYLTAGMVGVAATGMLKTLDVVFGPTRLLVIAINNILPSRFARTLHHRGLSELDSEFRRTFALAIPLLASYCLLVVLFAHPIMSLFGSQYDGHFLLVALYALSTLLSYVSSFLGTALRARRLTWQVFVDCAVASALVVPFGWAAIHWLGEYGTVLGMIGTFLAISGLHWRTYRRNLRQTSAGTVEQATEPESSVLKDDDAVAVAVAPARQLDTGESIAEQLCEQLMGSIDHKFWKLQRLSASKDVFLASRQDSQAIWQGHSQVVIKLFHPPSQRMIEAAHAQFDILKTLSHHVDGRSVEGWHVCSPIPILTSEEPAVLVMSAVSGRQLGAVLESPALASPEVRQSIARALAEALRQFWAEDLRVYGDLHFENIMCDVERHSISFVDPGPPINSWYSDKAIQFTQPASRDLAYLLYTIAMTYPGYCSSRRFHREMELAEDVLRAYVTGMANVHDKHQFLDEVRSCIGLHAVGGGAVKSSWRRLRRWLLLPTLNRILRRIKSECDSAEMVRSQSQGPPSATVWQSEAI